jgi:NDP-sugar pyrophosphorylase family protein
MKALILAAGFGTRLWPLTEDRTKPAIPFLNQSLISYSVEYLASFGIRDIIVNLHHQPESIRRVLGDGSDLGVRIQYSHDDLTGDDFVVINGKIVTTIDLGAAIAAHREQKAIATLILKENAAREHFSMVEIDHNFRITRFAGFPEAMATEAFTAEATVSNPSGGVAKIENAPLMFTGIQILSPSVFDYIPRNCFSHSTIHVYPLAIEKGEVVLAHISEGDWYEMSTLDRYFQASLLFMRRKGIASISGSNCTIEDGAVIEDSVLWDGVTVERGAHVRNCVLADNVRIPAGTSVEQAVVVRRDIVGEIERGQVVGENLVVPL